MISVGTVVLTNCPNYLSLHNVICKVAGRSSDGFYLDIFQDDVPFDENELIVLTPAQIYLYS